MRRASATSTNRPFPLETCCKHRDGGYPLTAITDPEGDLGFRAHTSTGNDPRDPQASPTFCAPSRSGALYRPGHSDTLGSALARSPAGSGSRTERPYGGGCLGDKAAVSSSSINRPNLCPPMRRCRRHSDSGTGTPRSPPDRLDSTAMDRSPLSVASATSRARQSVRCLSIRPARHRHGKGYLVLLLDIAKICARTIGAMHVRTRAS